MTKDAVATMGGLLPDDASGRDAVHVAVFSAFAAVKVYPGQDVAIIAEGARDVEVGILGTHVAIVDPFLRTPVAPGGRFWAYLYPRTITALSHRWSHPALEQTTTVYAPPASKLESEKWLRDFCAASDCPSYEEVLGAASRIADGRAGSNFDDEAMHFDGEDAHGEIPDKFWDHVSVVLGRPIEGPRAKYFSCSC